MRYFRNWSIRKCVNFSNFLKLAFIYCAALCWVIFAHTDYSKDFWFKLFQGKLSERKFSFYSTHNRIGEDTLYRRMMVTADKLGYDYSAFQFPESLSKFWLTAHFYRISTSIVNYLFQPEFNLTLTHHVRILPFGYNITYLNMPLDSLFQSNGSFIPPLKHLNQYDAYVDLYSLFNRNNEMLKNAARRKPIIALYFAKDEEEYYSASFDKALVTGTLWGCNRNSLRIAGALKKLAENGLLVAIGVKRHLYFLGDAYLGRMEDFGDVLDSLKLQQQKYGIALIIHNQGHMLDGIPTSRILEAVSSGSLVISDQNKFLKRFFNDSVLYYDAFANSDEIYNVVKSHIEWVKSHPDEARIKTQKAHKIFMENFTIENQLDKLFAFVKQQKTN